MIHYEVLIHNDDGVNSCISSAWLVLIIHSIHWIVHEKIHLMMLTDYLFSELEILNDLINHMLLKHHILNLRLPSNVHTMIYEHYWLRDYIFQCLRYHWIFKFQKYQCHILLWNTLWYFFISVSFITRAKILLFIITAILSSLKFTRLYILLITCLFHFFLICRYLRRALPFWYLTK